MLSPDSLFSIVNAIAALSWVALAALPRQRWVATWITGAAVPGALAVTYAVIILSTWGAPGSFSSLDGVAQLFGNRFLLLAGWIHYLAFDLLVGTWEVQDARERGVPHLLVVPCLFLTFMFGPAGWIVYQAVRRVRSQVKS